VKATSLLAAAAAVALTAVLAPPAQAKEWTKVVIATEGAYAPYNLVRPDGKLDGYEIELAANLCPRIKLECTFIATDWNGVIPGLLAGKYDAIMDGMNITPKRLEVIDFSLPYSQSPTTFAVMKTGPMANFPDTGKRVSLDDKAATEAEVQALAPALKGKVIGVQVSTIQADLLNTYFKGIAEIRTYGKTEEHDLDLQAGRVDLVLASTNYFVSTLSKPGGEQMTLVGPLFRGGLLGQGAAIGMRKGDSDLKDMFNKAIQAAKADGSMKALAIKWFKSDVTPQ
jgi:octopine/nopaline transport system substrate-binding protein